MRKCDWCGGTEGVVNTKYGTTRYNRLICQKCIKEVNDYHKCIDGVEKMLNEDGSYYEKEEESQNKTE